MARINNPIQPLSDRATLAEVIAKLNEVIEAINYMWHPEEE